MLWFFVTTGVLTQLYKALSNLKSYEPLVLKLYFKASLYKVIGISPVMAPSDILKDVKISEDNMQIIQK